MRDWALWSVSIGRFAGVQVRLHAFFLLFGMATLYLGAGGDTSLLGFGALSLGVLLVSVLLHELAHGIAAQRAGGSVEEIVLGPLGGLAPMSVPPQPQLQLIVGMAGPLVNLGLVFLAAMCLLVAGRDAEVPGLLNAFSPRGILSGPWWLATVKLLFWVNWILLLANMLPAPPFDGGVILRAILWPFLGFRQSVLVVALVAKITAGVLCVIAWFLPPALLTSEPSIVYVPLWLPVVMIALVLYFSAKAESERLHERELSEEWLGFDFSQQFADDDQPPRPRRQDPGIVERWLEKRRAARLRRQQLQEEEEEWRADDILARLHEFGMKSLSAEDRAILDRVSQRYRNRQNQ